MNSMARRLAAGIAFEMYAEKLREDGAFPIIVIGKEEEDRYQLYTPRGVEPDLAANTLIRVAMEAVGPERFFELLERMAGPDE